jgi:hypothetical protein
MVHSISNPNDSIHSGRLVGSHSIPVSRQTGFGLIGKGKKEMECDVP